MSRVDDSWQVEGVTQRSLHLLNSEFMADCTFVVGTTDSEKKKLRCHKSVLSQSSPVFYAMFNGELQEKGDVKVKDIEPQPFRKMLEYIYSDNTELENVETALSVCYAANKYMINKLIPKCIDFIKKNMNTDIVIRILEFARLIDSADLRRNLCGKIMLENESWREGTVAQRNLHVLNTEHRADCTFLVGITEKKRLRVHKYILSHASPVFDAMFNGELKEKGDVKVEDIEPQPFRKMLEYIYTDNTELENVETALSVCFAANKYMINSLVPKCINFIKKNLDPDIVCRVLAFVRLIDNADLEAESLQYLKTNTSNVLKSTSFPNTERATLLNILSQDHLSITSEVEVFLACIHWTTAHVDAENNLRDVLGPEVLGLIRFLTMTCEEFATVVVPSKLLEAHEERDILCCLITKSGNVPHGFSNSIENRATFRETIEIQTSNMHSRTAQTLNNYPFIFGVNVETYIYGLHLHGLYSGSPVKDSFEIKLLQGSEILASTKFEGWISQGQAIEVNFSKPILLQPVVNYTLQVMYTKSDLLYNAASNERRTIFTTSSSTKSTPPSNQNQIEYNTLNGVKMCMNFISTTIFKICIAKKV